LLKQSLRCPYASVVTTHMNLQFIF